jgi:hypothetical protein
MLHACGAFGCVAAQTDALHTHRQWELMGLLCKYTGYTQNNGAVSIAIPIETAPFFCVCPVYCFDFRYFYE